MALGFNCIVRWFIYLAVAKNKMELVCGPNFIFYDAALPVLAAALIFASWRIPATLAANTSWSTYCSTKYPCNAVNYLKTQPSGHIFAMYEWGGFAIWQLPKDKVFVDGRMPAWSTSNNESPYTTYLNIIQAREGWSKTLDEYSTDYLLISVGSFLDLELADNAAKWDYTELYRDNLAVVYKRSF